MPVPLSLYDRPGVALANLLSGRPRQAVQAVVSPNLLSPQDRQSLAERWGATGATKTILEVATNPLVIMALILHMKYPIAGAKMLLKFRKDIGNYSQRAGVVLRNIGTLQTNFGNTKIPKITDDLTMLMGNLKDKYSAGVATAVTQFEKTTGTPIGQKSMTRIQMWLKGFYKPGGTFQKSWHLPEPIWKGKLTAPEQGVANALRKAYRGVWDEVLGSEDAQQAALKVLRKRGDLGSAPQSLKALIGRLNATGLKVPATKDSVSLAALLTERGHITGEAAARIHSHRDLYQMLRQEGFRGMEGKSLARIAEYRDYAPEMVRRSVQQHDDMMAEMVRKASAGAPPGQAVEQTLGYMMKAAPERVVTTAARTKTWSMIPDPVELAELGPGEISLPALRQLEVQVAKGVNTKLGRLKLPQTAVATGGTFDEVIRNLTGLTGSNPATKIMRYSTLSLPVFQQYMQSVSKHYAWTTKGLGTQLMAEVNKLEDPFGQIMMRDAYIPQFLGRGSFRQSVQSMEWAHSRDAWLRRLRDPQHWMAKLIPAGSRKWLEEKLLSSRGTLSMQGASQGLASYFYLSTLGVNFSSAVKNLLQTTLTTAPMIGGHHTVAGMKESHRRFGQYWNMRKAGMGKDEAFGKAYRDFIESGLEPSPTVERVLKAGAEGAWTKGSGAIIGSGTAEGVRSAWQRAKEIGMAMFQRTEIFNRTTSYYGGVSKGMADGLSKAAASRLGRDLTRVTQFPVGGGVGPGQSPYMLRNVPPPLRQFMHFPLRYMEFLGSSLYRPWKGAPPEWRGLNLGTIGRGMGISAVTYQLGRDILQTDLSNALLTGALPVPMGPDQPFYPFPIVPPAVSLVGAGAHVALTGETEQLQRAGQLLVPGGVAGARAWRRFGPKYADYANRDEEGRIPVYSGGGSLIGKYSPLTLFAKSLWAADLDSAQERSLMKYLIAQRDQIRGLRRDYLEAVVRNDMEGAESAQKDFQDQYPGFGKIQLKKDELDTIRLRREITRLERVLDTLPPQYRATYGRMIADVLGQDVQALLGTDPSLLYAPRMTSRRRRRIQPRRRPRGLGGGARRQQQQPAGFVPLGTSGTSFNIGRWGYR